MPYVPRTVPAYAVRDPAYTAEVLALTLIEIDVAHETRIVFVSVEFDGRRKGVMKLQNPTNVVLHSLDICVRLYIH